MIKQLIMWKKTSAIIMFLMVGVAFLLVLKPVFLTDLLAKYDILFDEEYQCLEEDLIQYHLSENEVGSNDTIYCMSMSLPVSNAEQNAYHILLTSSYCRVNNVVRKIESDISKLRLHPIPEILRNDTFWVGNNDNVKKCFSAFSETKPYDLKCLRYKNVFTLDGAHITVETYLGKKRSMFMMLLAKHSQRKYNTIQGVVIKILLESDLITMSQLKDYYGYDVNVSDRFKIKEIRKK